MSEQTVWTSDLNLTRRGWRRRDMLRVLAGSALGASLPWQTELAAQAGSLRQQGKSCILLWMQGGPSQLETFDPKQDHANGGETRSIATNVSGIRISENLPQVAQSMDKIALLRSMTGKEGSHPRASYQMHTGYIPTASVRYPTLGSNVVYHLGDMEADLPAFVRIGQGNRGESGGGYLGVKYDPLVVADPSRPPENTTPATDERRFRRRLNLVRRLEANGAYEQARADHQDLLSRSSTMMLSPQMATFDLEREPQRDRESYGEGAFAQGCLMARRLVEQGVTFVEVNLNGWDTHDDNFSRCRDLCGQMDQPFARLVNDLEERGLLESTLVLCLGEFGRTPRINPRSGRDHFPRAFSAAIAGCGVRGGQVIGATTADGNEIADRPIQIPDFFRTVFTTLGVDPDHENMSGIGRPIPLVTDGEVITELFG
ncbi:MAG: DUF1501 domain-containing protein [Planctomycetales bacterium]|nr:DUF1501 domain-containing protein [Planctomycetales bacterium]